MSDCRGAWVPCCSMGTTGSSPLVAGLLGPIPWSGLLPAAVALAVLAAAMPAQLVAALAAAAVAKPPAAVAAAMPPVAAGAAAAARAVGPGWPCEKAEAW